MLVFNGGTFNIAILRCCASNSLEQWCRTIGWTETEQDDIDSSLPTFSVVRDPLPRFAHGFTEKMIKMWTGNNAFNKPHEYFVMESAVERLSDGALTEMIESILKEDWLNNWTEDQHIRLQSDWLSIFSYVTLVSIDNMSQYFQQLSDIPIPDTTYKVSNFTKHLIDLSYNSCKNNDEVKSFVQPDVELIKTLEQ